MSDQQVDLEQDRSCFDLISLNKTDSSDEKYDIKVRDVQIKTKILYKCLERLDGWKKSGYTLPGSNLLMRPDVNDDINGSNNSNDLVDDNSDDLVDDNSDDNSDDNTEDGLVEGIDYVRSNWYEGATLAIGDSKDYEVIEQRYNNLYKEYVSDTYMGKGYTELCLLGNEDVDTVHVPNYEVSATDSISNLISSLSVGAPQQYSPSLRQNQDAVTTLQIMLSEMKLRVKEEQQLIEKLELERQKKKKQQQQQQELEHEEKKRLELEHEKKKRHELREKTRQLEIEQMESDVYQSSESFTQSDEDNNNQRRKSKRLVTKTRNRLADDRADESNSSISCDGDEREDEDDDVFGTSQEFLSPQPQPPDDTDMLESCNNVHDIPGKDIERHALPSSSCDKVATLECPYCRKGFVSKGGLAYHIGKMLI